VQHHQVQEELLRVSLEKGACLQEQLTNLRGASAQLQRKQPPGDGPEELTDSEQ
jgi:hypothetical protein